jgi:hypothetical protein
MQHREARYAESSPAAVADLLERLGTHDVLITLSAGDGNQVGEHVVQRLTEDAGRGAPSPAGTSIAS